MNLGQHTSWDTCGGEYYFDQAAADHFCEFFPANLRYVQGTKAREPIVLEDWLKHHMSQMMGWKRTDDGFRRCRTGLFFVPRQNGKSTIAAGTALYMLTADGEVLPQVYSVAGTRDQARVVYNFAKLMCRKSPTLSQVVDIMQYEMKCTRNDGFYTAVASEPESLHGKSASATMFDELHTQPNGDLWDVMQTGTVSREQPFTFATTTAGTDQSSICYTMYERALRAIASPTDDPEFYCALYMADKSDDWQDPAVWAKANPNLGISVREQYLRNFVREAKADKEKINTFLRLHLNIWTTSGEKWIPMHHWDANARDINWDDYIGAPCWIGLDFARTTDIVACVQVFHSVDEPGAYVIKPTFWIPEEPISRRTAQDQRQVRNWAERGFIRLMPGSMIDHEKMIAELREIGDGCYLRKAAFDPAYAYRVIPTLEQDGWEVHPFAQTSVNFGLPCELMKGLLASQKLHHDGNPVLRWMADNAVDRRDASGNERPDKGKSSDKIDGIVGMLMGLAIADKPDVASIYEEAGVGTF